MIDFCKFSWREAAGAPLALLYATAVKAGTCTRDSASCSEPWIFPAALCRRFTAGIWPPLSFPLSGRDWLFGARTGRSREGTVLVGIAVTSGAHAGFVPWKSCVFPPFSNRRIFSSWCFWHCLTWRLWADGPLCRALWEFQAWTISLLKGLLLGNVPVKPA